MKLKRLSIGVIIAAALVLVVLLLSRREREPEPLGAPAPTGKTSPSKTRPGAPPQAAAPAVQLVPGHEHTPIERDAGSVPESGLVSVRTDRVLATVNGVPITLKDLIPLGEASGELEDVMTAEEFQARLQRAIEQELTFQAARARGVELTEPQQQQLQGVWDQRAADIQAYRDKGLMWTSINDAQVEFEVRHMSALLLQHNLLEKAGTPPPYPTEAQVSQYYQAHMQEFAPLPNDSAEREEAWQKIDMQIREKLWRTLQAEHEEAQRKLVEQLKAAAQVTVTPPASS